MKKFHVYTIDIPKFSYMNGCCAHILAKRSMGTGTSEFKVISWTLQIPMIAGLVSVV